MIYVFLDTNVIFDFTDTKDENILSLLESFFEKNKSHSIFCTTDYIEVFEIGEKSESKPFIEKLKEEKLFEIIDVNADLYNNEPLKNIDVGEWSIYLAIKKMMKSNKFCCVLCGDGYARNFFKNEGFLPCKHLVPPNNGIGGTIGILDHFECEKIISKEKKEEIINIMKSVGRRLP